MSCFEFRTIRKYRQAASATTNGIAALTIDLRPESWTV